MRALPVWPPKHFQLASPTMNEDDLFQRAALTPSDVTLFNQILGERRYLLIELNADSGLKCLHLSKVPSTPVSKREHQHARHCELLDATRAVLAAAREAMNRSQIERAITAKGVDCSEKTLQRHLVRLEKLQEVEVQIRNTVKFYRFKLLG